MFILYQGPTKSLQLRAGRAHASLLPAAVCDDSAADVGPVWVSVDEAEHVLHGAANAPWFIVSSP